MNKFKIPQIKVSKPNLDWSKLSFRKINWMTILAIMSYFGFLVVFPWLLRKDSEFIQFHAHQGLALLVIWVIFAFSFYFPIIPWIFGIFILICLIIGIVNVITGRERRLPLIGRLVA